MRSAGLRNKPVDRRYLSDKDKSDYNNSGEYSKAATALSRARAYRGREAYQRNRPMNRADPWYRWFTVGLQAQQARNREIGIARNPDRFGLDSMKAPSNKGDLFKPDDPA